MEGKKDSYLGDVGIIRKIDDILELKEELISAFDSKSIAIKIYQNTACCWQNTF
jgi:hypothetical protein